MAVGKTIQLARLSRARKLSPGSRVACQARIDSATPISANIKAPLCHVRRITRFVRCPPFGMRSRNEWREFRIEFRNVTQITGKSGKLNCYKPEVSVLRQEELRPRSDRYCAGDVQNKDGRQEHGDI